MSNVRLLVQQALDAAMYPLGVMSFWPRRGDEASNEYIVYTLSSDDPALHADNAPLYNSAEIILRYYYPQYKLNDPSSRTSINTNEINIQRAMTAGGFTVVSGPRDVGDIDDVGLFTSVLTFARGRLSDA